MVRKNCMRPSCRTKTPKYVLLSNPFFYTSFENTQPTPFLPLNNSKPEQTLVAKSHDKNAPRGHRD